ncbi:MAG: hypothetical protein Q8R40_05385 [bacterium]|nr:hypothetical protein [bacterium]
MYPAIILRPGRPTEEIEYLLCSPFELLLDPGQSCLRDIVTHLKREMKRKYSIDKVYIDDALEEKQKKYIRRRIPDCEEINIPWLEGRYREKWRNTEMEELVIWFRILRNEEGQ